MMDDWLVEYGCRFRIPRPETTQTTGDSRSQSHNGARGDLLKEMGPMIGRCASSQALNVGQIAEDEHVAIL